ncbi:MAG: thiamine-phosphate kinase [Phycisphaerales bacterium]|nr:thiamine-phosphate kinase [Phycisphaerales bacterium]
MSKGEIALVEWLRARFPADPARVPIGIGDDAAAVRLDSPLVAITTDMLLDGVHFDTERHGYELIGRKVMACSLSDCAAMACNPRAATVSVALPRTMAIEDVRELYEGIARIAEEYECSLVGGDTTSWAGRLAIDVAMLAEPMAPCGPVRRSTAVLGDTIFVSGPLGGSLAGRHLTFTPRIALARALAVDPALHAMMDISDGLSLDLFRLCRASGCAAELYADQLAKAISDDARAQAEQDGRSPLDHALSDGEDFELLVVGGQDLRKFKLLPVGAIRPCKPGADLMVISQPDGRREPLAPRGYEHLT